MLRTIEPAEMKRVETQVMANTAITGDQLMQAAAAHVAVAVRQLCENRAGIIVCACGNGNNGGDGLAAMRMLAEADEDFRGECWMLPGTLSADAQREMQRLRQRTPQVAVLQAEDALKRRIKPVCVIDAMFGTGLSRPLEGTAAQMCRMINQWHAPVVAVDIPSGLNGSTGEAMGDAVFADKTVTFHRPKTGLYLQDGPDCAGEIVVADIGLYSPEAACFDDADGWCVMEKSDLPRLLPKRRRRSHKGSYGKVLLWVGSRGMAGAAAISAMAALRTGAGLVTIACPDAIVDVVQTLCPCATCLPLPENARNAWKLLEEKLTWADAIGAGCGLGQSAWAETLLKKLLEWLAEHGRPAVLDADALNLLSGIEQIRGRFFITPHPAEAGRILHVDTAEVMADLPQAAQKLAEQYGPVVLKGACSLLCTAQGKAMNPFGTPAMAKGGSGDALTGITTALLAGRAAGAYRMDDLEVMQTACALHGLAGEMAQQHFGERGVLATDLCQCIGLVQGEHKEEEPSLPPVVGRRVTVTVEHPLGFPHEDHSGRVYPFNCGYVQEVLDEQNEWQDACILGVEEPLEWFEGVVRAVISLDHRSVWIVVPGDGHLTDAERLEQLALPEVETFFRTI